ncbi:hypothetical protein C3L33_18177, partial [Rhododendron williamsianum]
MQLCFSSSFLKISFRGSTLPVTYSASKLTTLTFISTPTSNPSLSNFQIDSLTFSEPEAISISNSFSSRKNLKNPQSVVHFLIQLGFSDAHIRSSVQLKPEILFSYVDKTLKPKLQFFQDLGLNCPDLGNFISTHSHVLLDSLERTLIPCIEMQHCLLGELWHCRAPDAFEEEPKFFFNSETALRDLISRVLDIGFSVDSRMFVHAILPCVRWVAGVEGSELLTVSEGQLKLGMVFFLYDVKLEMSAFILFRDDVEELLVAYKGDLMTNYTMDVILWEHCGKKPPYGKAMSTSATTVGIRTRVFATHFPQVQICTVVDNFSIMIAWFDNGKQLGHTVLNHTGMRQVKGDCVDT